MTKTEFNFGLALMALMRSKDPNTRNGACIIDPQTDRVVSVGYNGFPYGCSDDEYPWTNVEGTDNKYSYVVHAERNAIYNANRSVEGCHLYLFSENGYSPCSNCAQTIIQHKISKIILAFLADGKSSTKYTTDSLKASARMFRSAGITVFSYDRQYCLTMINRYINQLLGIKQRLSD